MAKGDLSGPDLAAGIDIRGMTDGTKVLGRIGDQPVLLARAAGEYFAVSAHCTHYDGPLSEGIIVGDTVRCPWHHACFDLRTGEALRAPAFSPLRRWTVERRDDYVFVREPDNGPRRKLTTVGRQSPASIVIVGGGASAFASVEMLRRRGYEGRVTVISSDDAAPIDRPNLSKAYLAGRAPEAWLPLGPGSFWKDNRIDLLLNTTAVNLDLTARTVELHDGSTLSYDRLLLATGAEPLRLEIPGADLPHVYTLRSFTDGRQLAEQAKTARRAVVLGASFIGLEVAASLRSRGIEVHLVAPERRPLERVFGAEMADFLRSLHQAHGVVFHLGDKAAEIRRDSVTLESGKAIEADLVVAGIGVRPRIELASRAGLSVNHGVVVNNLLQTSALGVFAAGDIARWPDPYSGDMIRVEHWNVAQRQGQTAARNMLGEYQPFKAVPFFWTKQYDLRVNYVGHAEKWDELVVEGSIPDRNCLLSFKRSGRTLAFASISRDAQSLESEITLERDEPDALAALARRVGRIETI